MGRNRRRDECVETPTRVFVRVFSFSFGKTQCGQKTDYWSATRISKFFGGGWAVCVVASPRLPSLGPQSESFFTFNLAIVQIRTGACALPGVILHR
jgi:hypothetical protein